MLSENNKLRKYTVHDSIYMKLKTGKTNNVLLFRNSKRCGKTWE